MKIPQTDSIAQLAEFWDAHEITDFAEELEEIENPFIKQEQPDSISLDLTQEEINRLEEIAKQTGLLKEELIKRWVLDRLNESPLS